MEAKSQDFQGELQARNPGELMTYVQSIGLQAWDSGQSDVLVWVSRERIKIMPQLEGHHERRVPSSQPFCSIQISVGWIGPPDLHIREAMCFTHPETPAQKHPEWCSAQCLGTPGPVNMKLTITDSIDRNTLNEERKIGSFSQSFGKEGKSQNWASTG